MARNKRPIFRIAAAINIHHYIIIFLAAAKRKNNGRRQERSDWPADFSTAEANNKENKINAGQNKQAPKQRKYLAGYFILLSCRCFLAGADFFLQHYFSSGSGNGKIIGKIKSSVKTKKKKIYGAAFILADILTAFIFSGAAKI